MSLRIFAVAAVVLAGAGGLQAIGAGGALMALLAAGPAEAAGAGAPDDHGGDAHAEETLAPPADPMADIGGDMQEMEAPVSAGAASAGFAEQIGASADEYRILISLQQRRRELEQREDELETRIRLVEAAEQRVEERLEEIQTVRAEIADMLGQLDEQEAERIGSLVSTYEKMKSKDAARILAGLDEGTAMLVLSRMKEASLAAVLGDMETPDAKRMTEALAAMTDPRTSGDPET